jgi:hypothetical protein
MMRKMPVLCLAFIVISSASHANLIQNGNFATGDFTDWMLVTTMNGSLGVGGLPQVISFDVTGTGPTDAAEFNVGQANFQFEGPRAGGGIEQVVTVNAGSYNFSANISVNALSPNVDGGSFSVLVDGVSEDSVNFGPMDYDPPFDGPLLRSTLAFPTALSTGPHEIEILITRDFQNGLFTPDQFITNISLVPQGPAIPEPATWTILGVALVAMRLSRRPFNSTSSRLISSDIATLGNFGFAALAGVRMPAVDDAGELDERSS